MRKEIQKIKERNKRVEEDKSWETSKTRRGIIAIFTYFFIVLFLYSMNLPKPWLSAIVPVLGYILSTLSLPYFRKFWVKYIYSK